ncbi:hypothetical protein AVEN_258772-1 [Araneus ventricosus]|uniref:Uncharacterized protein n=1 Tax=Araneus ventricosus TaxID=182803 RepID=A0A4Y2D095_ARAVE|nr:hypothetical protein AVEN_258772-1 [Araneus ventricosus]
MKQTSGSAGLDIVRKWISESQQESLTEEDASYFVPQERAIVTPQRYQGPPRKKKLSNRGEYILRTVSAALKARSDWEDSVPSGTGQLPENST